MTDELRSYGYVRGSGIESRIACVKLKDKQMKTGAAGIIMKQQSAPEGVKRQTRAAWPDTVATRPRRIAELGHINKCAPLTWIGSGGVVVRCIVAVCRASRARRAACGRVADRCGWACRRPVAVAAVGTSSCWTRCTSGSVTRRPCACSPSSSMCSASRSPPSCSPSTTSSSGSRRTRTTRSARCLTL